MIKWELKGDLCATSCGVKTTANKHIEITVYFIDGEPDVMYVNGYELDVSIDLTTGLFVGFGDNVVSLQTVVTSASVAYADLQAEDEKTAQEHEEQIKSMSARERYV